MGSVERNGSIDDYFEDPRQVVIRNGTKYDLISAIGIGWIESEDLEKNFTNCYVAVMELSYGRQTHPLAGGGFNFDQYVVLDKDYNILMIYTNRNDWIS